MKIDLYDVFLEVLEQYSLSSIAKNSLYTTAQLKDGFSKRKSPKLTLAI